MGVTNVAKAIGGLLSVIALLAILLGHVFIETVEASVFVVSVLLTLIGALLGVDHLNTDEFWDRFSEVEITVERKGDGDSD